MRGLYFYFAVAVCVYCDTGVADRGQSRVSACITAATSNLNPLFD
jgi:hypothetical protein